MKLDQQRYAEMATRFAADETPVPPGTKFVRGTPASRAKVTAMLLDAADTEQAREHIRKLGGRPARP